jgi:glycine cleavage system aminomethyltransferase T/glycine/D-amino acid oxidase-like deaminating enzyme
VKTARIIIIGAGIVGCSAAYHLARLGWREIVVLDQGPLPEAGGSTSHAPGLVFQTNGSKTMCELSQATVKLYNQLQLDDQPCFLPVGSMEVAATEARWIDLQRRIGHARSWGLEAALLSPEEAHERLPLLDPQAIYGAYYVPSDGLAKAARACAAMTRAAAANGAATFYGNTPVTAIETQDGRVQAVVTPQGRIVAEHVLICAGIWGPRVGRLAGVRVPLTPVEHQYVRTTPLAALAGETREAVHPILRHQDRAMYFRQHGDSYGVGSYQHEPLLVAPEAIRAVHAWAEGAGPMPSVNPFTPEHFAQPWRDAQTLLPALAGADFTTTMNGMFSFTPDGLPVLGESAATRGLWLAEAVWVTHGGGVGQAIAEWIVSGVPQTDLRECDMHRFEPHAHSPAYVRARGAQQYREVYDIIHPLQQMEQPRPLRTSPFYLRQRELGAVFFEGRGWERPQWYEANAALAHGQELPGRSGWAARYWSPIAAAEHRAARERVALFDMTSLPRAEVEGPGALAFLQYLTTNQLDRPVGSVTYTAMCDARGGVRSDVTVTRLAPDRFQLGLNGPADLAWLRMHLPADRSVSLREITSGTCCIGVWGPRARDLVQSLSDDDLSNAAFRYMTAREIFVGEAPVMAQRVSYIGELGWELYTSADYGLRLWDLLWGAGQAHGVVAAGRAAFDALRIEKGYRLWGADMTTEHDPYEAGLGFTVKLDKGDFVGRDALIAIHERGIERKLCCLTLDDPTVVVLGKEPIRVGERVVGYVTSAAYGYAVNASIAYGYLPLDAAAVGAPVTIEYFGERYGATVAAEPVYDPRGERLRSA